MKLKSSFRFLPVLAAAVLLFTATTTASAQRITNSSYQTVAQIKADGTIQDASYRTVGRIKSDGTVQDASYRTIGYLKSNGAVQDASYRTVGHIKDDGTVQDDLPMRWAAFFFFFSTN